MIKINGKQYQGNNLTMINGKIIIDGKQVTDNDFITLPVINITVEGSLDTLSVDNAESITVNESVKNLTSRNGNITVLGDVGDIKSTNGNIKCQNVSGDIKTVNGNIKHNKE